MSNSQKLLLEMDESLTPECEDILKDHKTLGLRWDTREDTFRVVLCNRGRVMNMLTKRILLSMVMSLFDPLGLVLPQAVMMGRLILRKIWKMECEWDAIIPEEFRTCVC